MYKFLKNNKFLSSMILCLLAIVLFASGFISFKGLSANAEVATSSPLQTNQQFTISVNDRNTGLESTKFTQEDLSFGKAFVYNWSDVSSMTFKYNPEIGEAPPKKFANESRPQTEFYDLSISIEYLRAYKSVGVFYQGETKSIESIFSTTVTGIDSYKTLSTLPNDFVLNIDEGKSASIDQEVIKIREWGIYRFKLLINGQETYSDFFVIEPTKAITNKEIPTFTFDTVSSKSSLHNDYIFTIKNLDKYAYIDSSKLVWYVTGKSDDGILYVLTEQDLLLSKFQDKAYVGLYPNYADSARTGLSFRFDDRGVAGNWEVWCEYNYIDSLDNDLSSKVVKFSTGSPISKTVIILSVIGLIVLSIGIAVIISLVKSKKDKVY